MIKNIHKKTFFRLTLTFILFTIVGTLTHECGHFVTAKYLGYSASIHYKYTLWNNPVEDSLVEDIYNKFGYEMRNSNSSLNNKIVNEIETKTAKDTYRITLGGPIQTMFTGTLAFLILSWRTKYFKNIQSHSILQWLLIFFSLFWLRQTANFILWIAMVLAKVKQKNIGDEIFLAQHFHLPNWFFSIITAIIGIMVLAKIISTFIPLRFRFTFIAAGLAGGTAGYILWFKILGPFVMP